MKRTPGRINVTLSEFLSGIERARKRRAAFESMARGRVKRARREPQAKPGHAWRRLDEATRQAAVAAVVARVESGEGVTVAVARVAAEHGIGKSTLSCFYHEARRARTLAGVIQEAAP